MPRKNTKQLSTNLTDQQIDALEEVHPGNKAALIRQLLRQYTIANGGQWPEHIGRGKYNRPTPPKNDTSD